MGGATTSRVYTLAGQGKLPEKTYGLAGERLWCPNEVSRWAEAGGKPMPTVPTRSNPWSKKATAHPLDIDGQEVDWAQSVKIKVRWRHNGSGRKQTFIGDGHRTEAQRLVDNVALAHRDRWADHDELFRPVPPAIVAAPLTSAAPAAADAPADRSPNGMPGGVVTGTATPANRSAPLYDPTRTVAAAVTIRQNQIMDLDISTEDKKNRLSALEFIKTYLVYPDGHPQLARLGIAAGSSFLFDDVEGLSTPDLLWFVTVRRHTSVTALRQYDRRVAAWPKDCDRIRREAAATGGIADLPERRSWLRS
jgi:hypothetical protein